MLHLVHTTSENPDFLALVRLLDQYLAELDGSEHAFYAQFNKTAFLQHVVVRTLMTSPSAAAHLRNMRPIRLKSSACMCSPSTASKA